MSRTGNPEIKFAVAILVAAVREAFPGIDPSHVRWGITADGKELQMMAPGLQWSVIKLED